MSFLDIIICNIGKEYVKAIAEKAKGLNMSRNEFLKIYLSNMLTIGKHLEGKTDYFEYLNSTIN